MLHFFYVISLSILLIACNNGKQTSTATSGTPIEEKPSQKASNSKTSKTPSTGEINDLTSRTNDPLRKELLAATRIPIEKDLAQKVKFEVTLLKENGSYTFFSGKLRNEGGGEIDFLKTSYREQVEAGVMENNAVALCKKVNGVWKCIDFMIGCTDVCYLQWKEKYNLKAELLGLDEQVFNEE